MTSTTLAQGWTLTLRSGRGPDGTTVTVPDTIPDAIPTSVPGCVHTDLLAHGLIPDPYLDRNEELVQWISEVDACYQTVVDLVDGGHERIDLVADGIDTVSTVSVNGTVVGTTRNQHRSHRFDLRSVVRPGDNEVKVEIDAPLRAARESEQRIGAKPLVDDALPYNALRKMACNFGWDWGPTLTTAGIWKPIRIHQWSTARLARVVPTVTVDPDGRGRVEISVELERTGDHAVDLDVELVAPDGKRLRASTVTTTASATIGLTVDHPQLWWPRGHGAQPLYQLTVKARHTTGGSRTDELDCWSHAIGFRTARLRMEPDDDGTCFEFHVNGERIWVRGANWIPADCFPSRLKRVDYERGVRDAVEAGMNMLRVWGGGLYESDDFYDVCNREGILVWQDFLFACAAYSEAEELWVEVEAEARENVARLAANPALVIWNGSNENIEGYYHWGFRERMPEGAAWGRGYYDDLLPQVLGEIDPTRAYIPSSP
ncbi:MAG: glycoside hydrolase family 2 protein, partial [Lapillicoccus sp.]